MNVSHRPAEQGFTLIEMMVSLLIFGMLMAAGVGLLSFSVRAQATADTRLASLSEIRRAAALLTADLAQATPRLTRDESGTVHPAFEGSTGQDSGPLLGLVRRGWENLDNANRPSVQKVEYRLAGDLLERRAWRFVDGAQAMPPVAVLEGVRSVRLRFRDDDGNWRERWDPRRPVDLPQAVELTIDTKSHGVVRQLFLVGRGG